MLWHGYRYLVDAEARSKEVGKGCTADDVVHALFWTVPDARCVASVVHLVSVAFIMHCLWYTIAVLSSRRS